MSSVAMSGSDSISINNRVLADFGDGDYGALTYPNEIAAVKTGKNGNSIYSFNATGKQTDVVLRIIRATADDKFFNNLMAQQQNNFASFILMTGQFVKKVGDGLGAVANDTYIMSGGVFVKQVEAKANAEGDSEQSISIYTLRFSNAPRLIA